VGLLANPQAAHGAAARIGRQVSHLLQIAGLSVVDLTAPTAPVARARAMKVRDTLTALVVVGGDGTVSLGAGIVAGTPVRLGIVPAGSGNDFARALGLPLGDTSASVEYLLQCLSRPVTAVDAIELVSDPDEPSGPVDAAGRSRHGERHRSVAVGNVSLGFDALVNARANAGRTSPRLRYTSAVLRELPAFDPLPFHVEIDPGPDGPSQEYDVDATLLTVANSGLLGGAMRLAPDARLDDGVLDLVTLEGLTRGQFLRFFPRVFRGTHTTVRGFSIRPVHAVRVSLRGSGLLRAYSDGEPRALLPVTARVLPGAVRVLAVPQERRSAS
jgi:diacylglycerol kinase (ATP)